VKKPPPDIWDTINKARVAHGLDSKDVIPPNAITLPEYRERYNVCKDTAAAQLKILVREGKLATGGQRRWTGVRWQIMRVYWPIGDSDEKGSVLGRELGGSGRTPKRPGRPRQPR